MFLNSQKNKLVSICSDQALPLHFAQFIGQGAAVYIEVIGQLLAVEGDGKAAAAAANRLIGEIGEQTAPDGFGRGVKDFPG